MRSAAGLLRTREFIMKDLYSFHASKEDAVKYYEKVKGAYFKIFKRCGLKTVCVEADPGSIGGELSNEFMVIADTGEDRVLICNKCGFAANIEKVGEMQNCPKCKTILVQKRAIESGHIFYLGDKYSKAMNARFIDKDGESKLIIMGCYGIGVGRLLSTIVEANHDDRGIIWPSEVAPFSIHLIPIESTAKVKKAAEKIYKELSQDSRAAFEKKQDGREINSEVLYDDRLDKLAGEKFAEADLIGIPYRIVVSERTLISNSVEIKKRNEAKVSLVKLSKVSKNLFQ